MIWLDDHPNLPVINCMQLSTSKHVRLLAVWFIAQLKACCGDDKIVFGQNRWRDENKEEQRQEV